MRLVKVPKVAEAVTEGTVSRWHVAVGDMVVTGQPLVEMITQKAEDDVLSPEDGRVAAIHATVRSTVPVGFVLCTLAGEKESLPDIDKINNELLAEYQASLMGEAPEVDCRSAGEKYPAAERSVAGDAGTDRVPATPAARRLAGREKIDLTEVRRVLKLNRCLNEADVRAFIEKK